LNRREKEQYLREYEVLKKKGKPFFPYAVLKDSAIALLVVAVIAILSIVLGAEQGPKVDPTTTTYTPRPEWYFFFLFELLRIFSNPNLILLGTIIVPTIFMVLLVGMPFIDRSRERRLSRRPIAIGFASATAVLLLSLTWYGSVAPGAAVGGSTPLDKAFANLACTTCHTLSAAGWNATGPGPNLDSKKPNYDRVKFALDNGLPGGMPNFKSQGFSDAKINCIATFVSSHTNGGSDTSPGQGGAPQSPQAACGTNGEQLSK